MKPLRATVRVRNNRLVTLREQLGLTQVAAAKLIGVQASVLSALETLRLGPVGMRGTWTKAATRISEFHGVSPEWIWPDAVLSWDGATTKTVEVDPFEIERLPLEACGLLMDGESPDLELDAKRIVETCSEAMSVLDPHGAVVLQMFYGLGGYTEHTGPEIAEKLNITIASVHSTKAMAIRRLRSLRFGSLFRCFDIIW